MRDTEIYTCHQRAAATQKAIRHPNVSLGDPDYHRQKQLVWVSLDAHCAGGNCQSPQDIEPAASNSVKPSKQRQCLRCPALLSAGGISAHSPCLGQRFPQEAVVWAMACSDGKDKLFKRASAFLGRDKNEGCVLRGQHNVRPAKEPPSTFSGSPSGVTQLIQGPANSKAPVGYVWLLPMPPALAASWNLPWSLQAPPGDQRFHPGEDAFGPMYFTWSLTWPNTRREKIHDDRMESKGSSQFFAEKWIKMSISHV